MQVPLHPEVGILELTLRTRDLLGLFPEIVGFQIARLFERPDGSRVLEVESRDDEDRLVRHRWVLGHDDLAAFRAELEVRLAETDVRPIVTTEGRGGLVLRQTLLGLGFYGWALPVALDVEDGRAAVATYLLTAGASFLVPFRLTRDRPVSDAHRDFTAYASSRGILHGAVVGHLLEGPRDDLTGSSARAELGAGLVASVAGAFAGFHTVERTGADEATVALWGVLGDAGTAFGHGSAYALGLYREEERPIRVNGEGVVRTRPDLRWGHAMGLAGSAAGLAAGGWLAAREDHTEGNATALRSMGLLGAHAALPMANAVGASGGRAHAGAALAGGLAGLAWGNRLLRREAFTPGDGGLLVAGQLGGAALGLGAAYLIRDEPDEHELLYLSSTAAGALLGFGAVYRALSERWNGAPPSSGGGADAGRLEAAIGPGGSFLVTLRF